VRLAAAIDWYRRGVIFQGRAAEIAGVARADFIDALAARWIEVVQIDFDARVADAAVANASLLILLSRTGCLDLLRVAGAPVVVPGPVLAEIELKGADDITLAEALRRVGE